MSILEHAYDLDIALDVIFSLRAMKCKEYEKETEPEKKEELLQVIDMMHYEREALYKGGEMGQSVMDKVFRLYAPILKAHYANI